MTDRGAVEAPGSPASPQNWAMSGLADPALPNPEAALPNFEAELPNNEATLPNNEAAPPDNESIEGCRSSILPHF